MRKLFYLYFICVFVGCCSNRKAIINNLISEINTPLNGKISDTLKLINCSCYLEENFFQFYLNAEAYSKEFNIDGNFYWDKTFKWSLKEQDIKYIDKLIKKQSKKKFKKSDFDKKNILLKNNFEKITKEDNLKAIKNGNYTYCLTYPIFNKNRDIAIISYKVILPNISHLQENKTIIYKKIENNWMKICVIKNSLE